MLLLGARFILVLPMVFGLLRFRHFRETALCPVGESMLVLETDRLLECAQQCNREAACQAFTFADSRCGLFNSSIVSGQGSGCYSKYPVSVIICGWSTDTVSCPLNLKLNVISANWGRTNAEYCRLGPILTTDCVLDSSLFTVQTACNGKHSCGISASFIFFGSDPCYGTFKYVEVTYTCI